MSQRDILTDRCFNPTHQDESPMCGVCVTRESRPEGTLYIVCHILERPLGTQIHFSIVYPTLRVWG